MEFQLSSFKSWKMMLWKCCTQYASKFYSISSFLISFSKKVVENKYIENVRSNCKYYTHGFFFYPLSTPKHLNHYEVYRRMAFRTFTMLYSRHFYLVSICGLLNVLFSPAFFITFPIFKSSSFLPRALTSALHFWNWTKLIAIWEKKILDPYLTLY